MDVEKTIKFLIEQAARHDEFHRRHEASVARHEARLDKHDKTLDAIKKLIHTGMKMIAKSQEEHQIIRSELRDVGYKIDALVDAQGKAEADTAALRKEVRAFIRSLGRNGKNGGNGRH